MVVSELTPGAGRGSECSFWLLPCADWVGDLSEPPGQKDTGWMCGWSRVELLTMASTRFKTPDNCFWEGGEKSQCLL